MYFTPLDHYFSCTIYQFSSIIYHWIIISHAIYTIRSLFLMHYIPLDHYFSCTIYQWVVISYVLYVYGSLFLMHYIPLNQYFSCTMHIPSPTPDIPSLTPDIPSLTPDIPSPTPDIHTCTRRDGQSCICAGSEGLKELRSSPSHLLKKVWYVAHSFL